MADLIKLGKRGGKEMAADAAKTDGMAKGTTGGTGGGKELLSLGKRAGKEFATEMAKTDGMCK
jgi:hypothetical protein